MNMANASFTSRLNTQLNELTTEEKEKFEAVFPRENDFLDYLAHLRMIGINQIEVKRHVKKVVDNWPGEAVTDEFFWRLMLMCEYEIKVTETAQWATSFPSQWENALMELVLGIVQSQELSYDPTL